MKQIPVYSIDRFNRRPGQRIEYQVEVFDRNRNFKVTYPHRHDDFYEILYITNGSGNYIIDSISFEIAPRSVFFLSPGQIHEIEVSEDIKGYIFLFTSGFYHFNKSNNFKIFELPFFYSLGGNITPLIISETDESMFAELFKRAISENDHNWPEKDEAIRALLDILLISFKRLYPEVKAETAPKGLVLVKRFKQLIEEKAAENISVKDFAEILKTTPSHLSETVKQLTGRTSTDLINNRMLLEIKRLLIHTELSISEIAYKLNFADQSYFSKFFKRLEGKSPAEFRLLNKK